MDWNAMWNDIQNFFRNNGWNILLFIAVLAFGVIFIKLLLNILKRLLNKTKMEKIAMQFIVGVVKVLLYLVLVLVLFSIIGIQITGIMTAFSAIILAIGVALENNIANFANGIVIISSRMFSKGDYIVVEDVNNVEGSITNINFLFTTLITSDNRRVTVPNSMMVNNPVTNNGANTTRRVQITFSVAYESDVELVKKIVTDVMKSNGKVYLDKDIFCRLKTINTSSLDFYSYCWVDKEDYWDVYYYLMENVYNEFKRNNICVPYSQMEIRNRNDIVTRPVIGNSLPNRIEKQREIVEDFDLENIDLAKVFKYHRKKNKSKTNKTNSNKQDSKKEIVENDLMDTAMEQSIAKKEKENESVPTSLKGEEETLTKKVEVSQELEVSTKKSDTEQN